MLSCSSDEMPFSLPVELVSFTGLRVNIIWFSTESHGRDQRVLDNAGEAAVKIRYYSAYQGIDEASFEFQRFENKFKESFYIEQLMVIGENQKCPHIGYHSLM